MALREYRAALRGATYRRDAPGVVELLRSSPWPEDVLQLVGEAVLVVLVAGSPGGEELAQGCVARLRARTWEGDADLADFLDARLDQGPQPLLRSLPVDLEELAMVLEGDPTHGGGKVDLNTGQVWPDPVYDDYLDDDEGEDEEENHSSWLCVDPQGSRSGYRDMELFIDTVPDPHLAELLTVAITGPGAFRRFKDALCGHPEAADRWYALREDRVRGRARSWLASQGYTPQPTGLIADR